MCLAFALRKEPGFLVGLWWGPGRAVSPAPRLSPRCFQLLSKALLSIFCKDCKERALECEASGKDGAPFCNCWNNLWGLCYFLSLPFYINYVYISHSLFYPFLLCLCCTLLCPLFNYFAYHASWNKICWISQGTPLAWPLQHSLLSPTCHLTISPWMRYNIYSWPLDNKVLKCGLFLNK